jgi:hypothetical protein
LDFDGHPDFLCVGAQKAGTTWLYHQLNCHPEFWMPTVKELHYLDEMSHSRLPSSAIWREAAVRDQRDQRFVDAMRALCSKGFFDLRGYGRLFAPKGELLSGDIGPVSSVVPEEMIAAIMDYFPQLKIVFIARDPVEQVWSALSMAVRNGNLPPFDVNDPRVIAEHLFHPDILCRSFPSMIVARWRRHVPPTQLGLWFFDDLQAGAAKVRAEILRFLGADPEKSRTRADERINEERKKLPMSAEVREQIARFFARELRACASELGGAAVDWPARYGLS